jgi:L-alanine-DL-glutamate epimerase-like enolase superfamily enzyme
MGCRLHRTCGSALLWAASLQLAAATPNCIVFEFCQAYYPLLYDLLTTPVALDADGDASVPTAPGLGVGLQPEDELVRKYPFEGSTRYAPARQAVHV